MQKHSLGKTNKSARDARVRLSNSISLGAMSPTQIKRNIATYIAFADSREFLTEYQKLIAKPAIRTVIQSRSDDLETFGEKPIFDTKSSSRSLDIYEAYFRSEETLLRDFVALRSTFESLLLQGRFETALGVLSTVKDQTGESLWLMRSTMLTFALAGRLEEMNDYCQRCKDRVNDRFLSFIFNCFLLISTDPLLHSRKIIANSIRELEEAGVKPWADLLTLLLVPTPTMQSRGRLECLEEIQNFPVIDQFVLLPTLISHNLASAKDIDSQQKSKEVRLLELAQSFEGAKASAVHVSEAIITSYESGDYFRVDELFYANIDHDHVLLPLIGLVAKAQQIVNVPSVGPPNGPLHDICESLRGLYSLDLQPRQAIDKISSLSVQLHHFRIAPLLQLTLYSALPHHYSVERRQLAARKSRFQSGQSTAWTASLEKSKNPLLNYQYLSGYEALPEHRILKQEIRALVDSNPTSEDLIRKLSNYASVSPLPKDYFELASSSLIHADRLEELIAICATALADEPNAYTAFPLSVLAQYIIDSSISTLDALVIVYFYVKDVDSSKEYLLNEIFEEFLLVSDARRPSDLISSAHTSSKMKILLRDVSTIETMDFLGSFDSSNDVRAERIRILDYLRDVGDIDPELHKKEVEEIVGLVIVDSAATEFSVHKIDVNDGAIRRKVSEDISSLLSLYKSASDEKEEKFIRVQEDNSKIVAKAVVAGDRNTTLLKIINVVRNAFLYDDKYGLDKNLSAEIRHGFFSNLMRSKLEDRHLLTETNERGEYKNNEYWIEANGLLAPGVVDRVDAHLKWFSSSFNQLIGEAEEWMKVTTDADNLVRVFHYSLYLDQFNPLISKIDAANSADEVTDFCLGLLWQQTEIALNRIREKINIELRQRVDQLFSELNDKLNEARGNAALAELFGAIHQTKNGIREDISTVTEWFRRADSASSRSLTIADLVDTAAECYARVRHKSLKLSISLCAETAALTLDGIHMKAFVVALLNVFENCVRHSGYGMDTAIRLSTEVTKVGWNMEISNPLTDDRLQRLNSGGLASARLCIASTDRSTLVRIEGGSGLGKIVNHLSSISDRFTISVNVVAQEFQTRIAYE